MLGLLPDSSAEPESDLKDTSIGGRRKANEGSDEPKGFKRLKVPQAKVIEIKKTLETLWEMQGQIQEEGEEEDDNDKKEKDSPLAASLVLEKLQTMEQVMERMDALVKWDARQEKAHFHACMAEGSCEEQNASDARFNEIRTRRDEAIKLLEMYPGTVGRVSIHDGLKPTAGMKAFIQSKVLDPMELVPVEVLPKPQIPK